ncbi:MAG: aminoacyl-tRNA deacylase [Methylocystaceae bacterium]
MRETMIKNLRAALDECNFKFELIPQDHQIKTAQEGADYFGIAIGQTAPTLVLKTDQGYFALIVSGDRGNTDFQEVAALLNCSKVKLASPKEVLKVTGCLPGNVSMVKLTLPCIIDQRLKRYPFIYGGTGIENLTLKIDPKALEFLNQTVGFLY